MRAAVLRGRLFPAVGFIPVIALMACGGEGTTTPPVTNPTPTIAIALSASSLSVQQGASGSVTATVTRGGGFTGDVAVSVEGLPTGVTGPSATIASSATSATLNLSAAATAAAATSNLTVRATGTGVTAATASLGLTVTAIPVTGGSFALSSTPASISIAQGAVGSVTINIARTNFTGAVGLAVTGATAGLTTALSSTSTTGNSATLTLTAGAALAPGVQNLTITGTGTGASNATTTVAVTITSSGSPGGGGNASWKFCGATGLPLWVAFQDGSGAWTRVTGSGDTYAFNISSARGGVAWVVASGTGFDTQIFYGTQTEIIAQGSQRCGSATGAGKTVTAAVIGAAAGADMLQVSLGTQIGTITSGTATFTGVPAGSIDLVASRAAIGFSGTSATFNLNKMIIRRNLNPAAGSALAAIDFGAAEAFDPVQRNMTVNNLGSEVSLIQGSYITSNNTTGVNSYLIDIGSSGSVRTYKGVPSANQATGDLHVISVIARPNLTETLAPTRQVMSVFKDATDKTVTLGPLMTAPTVAALSATGYGRTRCTIPLQPEYNRYFSCDVQQTGSVYRRVLIQHSSEYATSFAMDVPDFSAVTGFDVNWGLKVGTAATWSAAASGWTGSTTAGNALLTEGLTLFTGTRMGNVTP